MRERLSEPFATRLDGVEAERVHQIAEAEERSLSQVLRQLGREGLEQQSRSTHER